MLYGVDVSHHQGGVDWTRVAGDGIAFAMLKATEPGANDTTFKQNVSHAKNAGLVVGAYHFLHPGSGAAQARHYVDYVGAATDWRDTAAVVDCETTASGGRPARDDVAAFVTQLRAELGTGRPVGVYTGRWYWSGVLGDPDLTRLGVWLWESRYVTGSGAWHALARRIPRVWFGAVRCGGLAPSIVQYSSSAAVAGVPGRCDVDAYAGTLAELRRLLFGTPGPVPKRTTTAVFENGDDEMVIVQAPHRPWVAYFPLTGTTRTIGPGEQGPLEKIHKAAGDPPKAVVLTTEEFDLFVKWAGR